MILAAILGVLIFIAILLAPWLISVAIALSAIGGAALVVAVPFVAISVIIGVAWGIGSAILKDQAKDQSEVIRGERKACPFCQCEMSVKAFICKNCGN